MTSVFHTLSSDLRLIFGLCILNVRLTGPQVPEDFKFSESWAAKFKNRYDLHVKRDGAGESAEDARVRLRRELEGYSLRDIYNWYVQGRLVYETATCSLRLLELEVQTRNLLCTGTSLAYCTQYSRWRRWLPGLGLTLRRRRIG